MSSMSAEATVVRNYLDWMVAIPWNNKDKKTEILVLMMRKKFWMKIIMV